MEYDSRVKRLVIVCFSLVVYILVCLAWLLYSQSSAMQRDEYKAAVSSLHGRFHQPMSYYELEHIVAQLEQIEAGGPQPLLGLGFEAPSLDQFLGVDEFDMSQTIELLKDNRLRPAQANLLALANKVTRARNKESRQFNYLLYIGILAGMFIVCYLIHLSFRLRDVKDAPMAANDRGIDAPTPNNFSKHLKNIVREEVTFTGHPASVELQGLELSKLPESLFAVTAQLIEQLVRNSVEHGGRLAQQRVTAGKPGCLEINVMVRETKEAYIVIVRDDGEGMDPHRIFSRAKQLGLISDKVAGQIPSGHMIRLIFLPGFRGEKRQVSISDKDHSLYDLRLLAKEAGGTFAVKNRVGQYCQFTVKFPRPVIAEQAIGKRGGAAFSYRKNKAV